MLRIRLIPRDFDQHGDGERNGLRPRHVPAAAVDVQLAAHGIRVVSEEKIDLHRLSFVRGFGV
jgi:hypothetical protein